MRYAIWVDENDDIPTGFEEVNQAWCGASYAMQCVGEINSSMIKQFPTGKFLIHEGKEYPLQPIETEPCRDWAPINGFKVISQKWYCQEDEYRPRVTVEITRSSLHDGCSFTAKEENGAWALDLSQNFKRWADPQKDDFLQAANIFLTRSGKYL